MHNLSIVSPRKTAARTRRRRARPAQHPLLERVLGAAEDAILDSSQPDAILAHLAGVPYRVRFRTLAGSSHVIVAILDRTTAPHSQAPTGPELRKQFGLTDREAEVARLLADRMTNKEIARTLGVSTYTAERHTERILNKLGISSRRHVLPAITGAPAITCS